MQHSYLVYIMCLLFKLSKPEESNANSAVEPVSNQQPPTIENPSEGSGRSIQEYYFPPNQGYRPPVMENHGYGYIPPQVPMFPQQPPQGYPYPLYEGAYPPYPYYANYGAIPQKPYAPNYLQVYDTYYGGGRTGQK